MKPFKSYAGGKEMDGTFQKIINLIPPHDIYIELFLGNGAIYRKKKPSRYSILIDIDPSVVNSWEKQKLLPGSILKNTDAILFIQNFQMLADILKSEGLNVFIYADPPYPIFSRKAQKKYYTHEMTNNDHERLLESILLIDANIMISSYPNEIYSKYLQNWNNEQFKAMTRGGLADEVVFFNYPKPEILHDYKYMGETFRERERIKGIICRNASKLKAMPAAVRNAIIEQIT